MWHFVIQANTSQGRVGEVFVKKTKTTPLEGSAKTPKAPESGNVHWAIIYNNSRSCENMQIAKFTFKYILALAQFVIRV